MPSPPYVEDLPPNWWRDAEGATAFLEIFQRAVADGSLTGLGWVVEEAEVLGQIGADGAARSIVLASAVYWLRNVGPGMAAQLSAEEPRTLDLVAELLADSFVADELSVPVSASIADVYRRSGDLQAAADWYQRASRGAEALGTDDRQGIYLQSLGAVLVTLGNSGAARAASEKAALIFEQRGDARRLVTVQLNLVQQDLTEDALDRAEARLEEAKRTASTFRDGHINSSIRRLEAMLLIERGDYGNARSQLLRVYRSRLRAGDLPMAEVAAQNIARLTHDVRGAEASLRWWRTALDLAGKTREIEQQLLARRGLAKALLEHGDNAEAITHLKVLADMHDDLGDEHEGARVRADLGAAYLSLGQQKADEFKNGNLKTKRSVRRAYVTGKSYLLAAFRVLEALRDEEWLRIVAHNLRIAWYVLELETEGIDKLLNAIERVREWSPGLAARLLRSVGELQIESEGPDGVQQAANQFLRAANEEDVARIADPFAIVADADRLAAHLADPDVILALLGPAERSASQLGVAVLGDLLNDFALVLAERDDFDIAMELLERVLAIAAETSNRVLRARAELNLGEIAFRQEQFAQAGVHLAAAGELSEAVGDLEQASLAYSSCANSYLSIGARDRAFTYLQDAERLAHEADAPNALARAISARASLAFDEGAYQKAFDLWIQAASGIPQSDRAAYRAFALDALAMTGNWEPFSYRLDSFANESQRAGTQLAFARELWHSASTWLKKGYERRSAKVLAYATLLSVERASHSYRTDRFDESRLPAEQVLLGLVRATVPVRTYLDMDDLSESTRQSLARWFEWYVRDAVDDGSEADAVLHIALDWPFMSEEPG